MSEKMTCPGCGAHTSSVLAAVRQDEPCPSCGLSAAAIMEVTAVRQKAADEGLKTRLETVLIERDRALAEAARLRRIVDVARRALVGEQPDDPDA